MKVREFIELLKQIEFKSVLIDDDTDKVIERSVTETYENFGFHGYAIQNETLIIKREYDDEIIKIYDSNEKDDIEDNEILDLTFVRCSIDLYQYMRKKKYRNSASSLIIYVE